MITQLVLCALDGRHSVGIQGHLLSLGPMCGTLFRPKLDNRVTIYSSSRVNWKHSCSSSPEPFCGSTSNEGPYKYSLLLLLLLLKLCSTPLLLRTSQVREVWYFTILYFYIFVEPCVYVNHVFFFITQEIVNIRKSGKTLPSIGIPLNKVMAILLCSPFVVSRFTCDFIFNLWLLSTFIKNIYITSILL